MKWSDVLPKIKWRIESHERLTVKQGEMLYQEYLTAKQEAENARSMLKKYQDERDWANEYAQELVEKWNELVNTLDRAIGCSVYGTPGKAFDEWTAEYNDKQVTAPSIPEVYEAVIRDRLASEPRQVFRQGYETVPAQEELKEG